MTSPRIPVVKGSGLHPRAPDMNFLYGHLQEKGAGARCKLWHYSIDSVLWTEELNKIDRSREPRRWRGVC